MKKKILVLILGLINYSLIGQITNENNEQPLEVKQPEILTIGIGTGYNSFFGDFLKSENITPLTNIRSSYFFTLEKRLGNLVGIQLLGSKGILSDNERSTSILNNRNFESQLLQVGANLILHFDNDVIINRKSPFSPYVSAGFSFLKFDSSSDIEDENGNQYYYWENGTIQNIAQNDTVQGETLYRDYTYETLLEDSLEYSRNTFSIPLTLGFKWKLSNNIQGRIFGTYNLTMTDWIDNISANDDNDKYAFIGFSLHYTFRKPDLEEKNKYRDVKFKDLSKSDEDADGVIDVNDICHHTPANVKVNEKGCPLDDDNDGVPNYIDQEPNTKSSVHVDELGRELTDSLIYNRIFIRDSIETERTIIYSDSTDTGQIFNLLDKDEFNDKDEKIIKTKLSELLFPADLDENGLLSKNEINLAINSFFEGKNDYTVTMIYDLIDYYFDQY